MRRRAQLALVVGMAVVLVVIVAAMFGGSRGTRQAADQTPTGEPATEPPATEPPASPSSPAPPTGGPVALTDGIYLVGADISAGTYVTTAGDRPCYWARLRSFGQSDSVIDDRNVEPGQSERVVVRSSDRGFKVSNGCTWRSVL